MAEGIIDCRLETLGMQAVNLRGIDAQRAVHKDREGGEPAGADQPVEHIDNLLRAADGKCGDDDLAFSLESFKDDPGHRHLGIRADGVFAPAVRGFDLEIIHILNRLRVVQDFIAAPAHIAAEEVAELPAAFVHIQDHLRGAEDVPGIPEGRRHPLRHQDGATVADADELVKRLLGVGDRVKRRDGRQILFSALLGNKRRVLHLDTRRIHQQDAAEVAGGEGAMDVAGVALPHQVGQIARMIHVGVAQYQRIHGRRIEREMFVPLLHLGAMALEQSAFQQDLFAVDLDQVHRAGGGPRRAEVVDLHAG